MNRIRKIIITALLLFIPFVVSADEKTLRVYLFHQESCPHCKKEIQYLEELKNEYSNLDVVTYEVSQNVMNYNFMNRVIDKTGIVTNGQVPFTIIGTDYYIGFEDHVKKSIKDSIDKFLNDKNSIDVIAKVKNGEDVSNIKYNVDPKSTKVIPILGEIDAKKVSLPLVAIVIGAVDGFNPCAMWVLLFLIGMLFHMKDKKKMWILGITFLLTSAVMYLLIMAAWLKVALSFMTVVWLRIFIAIVALVAGLVNLNSYIKEKKRKDDGCEIVDEKKRKKMFTKIKKITSEKKFILAIFGIIALAISVNLVEIACSAGLPLIFTQILALNDLSTFEYVIYMLIYILFFLIDDIVVFVIAMLTLNIKGISSKYGKYSHLIGGIIMILIGILMIFKPEWLMFNFG
jgi:thiol-disulfide isomerase/thioredoxin